MYPCKVSERNTTSHQHKSNQALYRTKEKEHPFVCIGENIKIEYNGNLGTIEALYVSPSGQIGLAESNLCWNKGVNYVALQIIDHIKFLQEWSCDDLNTIASTYFYEKEGQAFQLIDIMARCGYLTYSDEEDFKKKINSNIGDSIFNLTLIDNESYSHINELSKLLENIVIIQPNFPTCDFTSRRAFISRFSDIGGVDPDEVTEFICELESIPGLLVYLTPTALGIHFTINNERICPIYTFISSSSCSDFIINIEQIQTALHSHGYTSFNAKPFFRKALNVPNINKDELFYYSDISVVLNFKDKFITATKQFLNIL